MNALAWRETQALREQLEEQRRLYAIATGVSLVDDLQLRLGFTGNEARLLALLIARSPRSVAREGAVTVLWGEGSDVDGLGSLKVLVHGVRRKLAAMGAPMGVITQRYAGLACERELADWVREKIGA